MKVISIINLKGGVAKTISAINISYILASVYGMRVLMIDNDKQGNTSKFFGVHSYDDPSIADILTDKNANVERVIKHTPYSGLDVIPANMRLLVANRSLLIDTSRTRDYRLQRALQTVTAQYDYCVVDNAPDINTSVINALITTDDVLVPVKIDKFAFDGLEELVEQIEDVKESNERLNFAGCFFTMFQQNNVNAQGDEWLRTMRDYPVFDTRIRNTVKVTETTYSGKPLQEYSKNSTAAKDYIALVAEYLKKCDRK